MKAFFEKLKAFFIGREARSKNFVRYLLIVVAFLVFLFFSNDFDLINIQKTAIVTAIGIDREGEEFSITSQIALPSAKQGDSGAKTVNVVAKGKTVAQALDQVNEKTGWYPKLVFCRLILLGESATQENVFDGLNYFLRDEYITDNCLVAACEGKAEELLGTKTPIDTASALAIEKVLSGHAERLGTSLPNTLREFSASYYGESKSGFLPLVKAAALAPNPQEGGQSSQGGGAESKSGQKQGGKSQGGEQGGQKQGEEEEKSFSAEQTALFVQGKLVGKLDKQGTFTLAVVKNQLRLAAYSLPYAEKTYTMTIKRSSPDVRLDMGANTLRVEVAVTAGLADVSAAQSLKDTTDAGDFPKTLLSVFQKRLTEDIKDLFSYCHGIGFDAFDAIDKLQKYENEYFDDKKDTLLKELDLSVEVQTRTIR